MSKKLTCTQVCDLLNFYIEGKLSPQLKTCIDEHIKSCQACRNKIKDLYKNFNISHYNDSDKYDCEHDNLSKEFINNLSAYIDNELNPEENIKIKKITISNPTARKKLHSIYKFQKFLHSTYNRTKNDLKYDYSKQVIAQLQNAEIYSTTCFYKITPVIICIILLIIAGFIYLYF